MTPDATIAVASTPSRTAPTPRIGGWSAMIGLAERELVRFFRQRNRVIGALVQPLIFWVLFGSGLRDSFRPPAGSGEGVPYAEYFYPGILVLIVLFTAIFATISIIQDRREGFLQGVLVAPTPRSMIVLGKVLGGAVLALLQAWLFLALAPWAGIKLSILSFFLASGFLLLLGIGLTSLGACLAWRMDSVQGFHAIMSVLLMPMWLLSGAFFPSEGASTWLQWMIALNPVTYGVAGLRRILYLGNDQAALWTGLPSLWFSLLMTVLFAGVMFLLATLIVGKHSGESR